MAASTRADKFRWWEDVRFGVFFHWGIYSSLARGEWVRYAERIPFEEYKKLTAKFRPKNNWAEEWMKFIKRAGAGYAVLTTKHHDGYCLFDTKTTTDYSAPTTAPGRDLVAEYVEACRKQKIKVGLYYSPPDWRYYWDIEIAPRKTKKYEEYKEVILTHIEELCTSYGKIDLWWWDGTPPEVKKTVARMRRWQPEMMINDRCGLKLDCGSAEMALKPDPDPKHRWEVCLTSNNFWGYFGPGDKSWLSLTKPIHWLTRAVSDGGNFLYNVGPMSNGGIPNKAQKIFAGIGDWLKKHGDAVYGCGRANISGGCSGFTSAKGKTAYLHILQYTYPYYVVISPKVKVESATIMKTGKRLNVQQEGERVILTGLPPAAPDMHDTVIVLSTDGAAEA